MNSPMVAGGGRSGFFRHFGRPSWYYVTQLVLLCVGYSVARRPTFVTKLPLRGGSMAMGHAEMFNAVPASWLVAQPQKEKDNEYYHEKLEEYLTIEEVTATPIEENHFQPASINTSEMALALRWTAEVNRQLQVGNLATIEGKQQKLLASGLDHLRGGGGAVMTYRIPMTGQQRGDDDATIFHAQTPRSRWSPGSARWGASLEEFLQRLFDVLRDDSTTTVDPELELTLAMMYLDRACSVETSRSVAHLPFCTPRTVHRLALTAMLVAVAAVRGVSNMTRIYDQVEASFGISTASCQSMVEWMRSALGDAGIFVTPDEMREWKLLWEGRFAP
jgi:hypothetical protein